MLFDTLFPNNWVQDTFIPEMNKHTTPKIKNGRVMMWVGMHFLMSTTTFDGRNFFVKAEHRGIQWLSL